MATEPRPVVYTTLFAQDAQSPYIAMTVLLVVSLRRVNARMPCIVFDYSLSDTASRRLAPWQDALRFEVRPLRDETLLQRFEPRHVWCLRYDAPLRMPPDDTAGNVFIHFDADTICIRDPVELAAGDFDYRLPVLAAERFAIGDWLAVFDLRKENARRALALARALNQERYIWRPLDYLSSRRHDYPASDSCMEAAVQLLGQQGHKALDAETTARYLMHYARHETQHYAPILEAAQAALEATGLRERFESDFGPLRPLIFRKTSGYDQRIAVVTSGRVELTFYADEPAALVPLRAGEAAADTLAQGQQPAFTGNETARLLWQLTDGRMHIGAIVALIADALGAPRHTVLREAEEFYLEQWREGRLRFAPRLSRTTPPPPRAPELPVLVVVLGLHASGIRRLAGALAALGVYFGAAANAGGDNAGNAFAEACSRAFPEPDYRRTLAPLSLSRDFAYGFDALRRAHPDAKNLGAAHPAAIALVPELEAAYRGPIRYVHVERPLDHSVAAFFSEEMLRIPRPDPVKLRHHQTALWELKQVVLASRSNLSIDYYDLIARPDDNIRAIIGYLDLNPTAEQITEAKARIRPPDSGWDTA